jgi:hypothetical protein
MDRSLRQKKLASEIISLHISAIVCLCDSGLPSSGGAIHPCNEYFYILFPFNLPYYFGKYIQARPGITFGGIQPFICVVKCGGGHCAVKDV